MKTSYVLNRCESMIGIALKWIILNNDNLMKLDVVTTGKIGKKLILTAILIMYCSSTLEAQEFSWDELDTNLDVSELSKSAAKDDLFSLQHTFEMRTSLALDSKADEQQGFLRRNTGLSEMALTYNLSGDARISERLKLKWDIETFYQYFINYESQFHIPDDQFKTEESRVRLQETYLQLDINEYWWLRHGNLIIAYGSSDAFQVLDKFNARDNSLWGQEDIEDSRIPVWSTQLVHSSDQLDTQLVVSHQFTPNRVALPGHDYDDFLEDRLSTRVNASSDVSEFEPEYLLSFVYRPNAWDLSGMVGRLYNKSPVLLYSSLTESGIEMEYGYKQMDMWGLSASRVFGDFLMKSELANLSDMAFFRNDFYRNFRPDLIPESQTMSQVSQSLFAIEYSGFSNTIFSIESFYQKVFDWDSDLRTDKYSRAYAINLLNSALNDKLESEFRTVSIANGAGYVGMLTLKYAISDSLSVGFKWVEYFSGDREEFFDRYQSGDRLSFSIKLQS